MRDAGVGRGVDERAALAHPARVSDADPSALDQLLAAPAAPPTAATGAVERGRAPRRRAAVAVAALADPRTGGRGRTISPNSGRHPHRERCRRAMADPQIPNLPELEILLIEACNFRRGRRPLPDRGKAALAGFEELAFPVPDDCSDTFVRRARQGDGNLTGQDRERYRLQ